MQGHEAGEGISKSDTGLQSLGQGGRIRAWNGEGRAGLGMWSSEMELRFVDEWDTQWKILE